MLHPTQMIFALHCEEELTLMLTRSINKAVADAAARKSGPLTSTTCLIDREDLEHIAGPRIAYKAASAAKFVLADGKWVRSGFEGIVDLDPFDWHESFLAARDALDTENVLSALGVPCSAPQ